MIEGLAVGRIVHVKIKGECRPAIVSKIWGKENGCSNLNVFPDGSNDDAPVGHTQWQTSVLFGPGDFEWHWPERD